MVLVQNKYNSTLVGVLRTQITFVTHSSPSCYVTLRTQMIRLNSGNLSPQKTDSGVFIITYIFGCGGRTLAHWNMIDRQLMSSGIVSRDAFFCNNTMEMIKVCEPYSL